MNSLFTFVKLFLISGALYVFTFAIATEGKMTWIVPPSGAVGPASIYDEDDFNRCYAKYVKPGLDKKSQSILESACQRVATPKTCRELIYKVVEAYACKAKCEDAGFFSKRFGECSHSDSL